MTKQTIAVDVDDVLAYHADAFVDWSNDQYGTKFTIEDYTDHWGEMWSIDRDETEQRAKVFHNSGYHRQFRSKEDAFEVLAYLKRDYELVVVTARREDIIEDSKQWLQEHYPNIFKDIRFVPIWEKDNTITKAAICHELGAEYLIDDLPRHCNLAASEGIHALLFGNYNWNSKDPLANGVTRVVDWHAVREYFDAKRS